MSWALVYQKTILEIREEKFPVSEEMEWIEVDPSKVDENYVMDKNGEFVPPPPKIEPIPIEKVDVVELKSTADKLQIVTADLIAFALGKITKEELAAKYPDIKELIS